MKVRAAGLRGKLQLWAKVRGFKGLAVAWPVYRGQPRPGARPAQPHPHPHPHGVGQALAIPKLHHPRHPEGFLLYQTIAGHFQAWLELASAG